MIGVNIIGLFLNVVYLMVFYKYTPGPEKFDIWVKIGYAGILNVVMLAYTYFEDPTKLETRLGLVLSSFLFIMLGLPLKDIVC